MNYTKINNENKANTIIKKLEKRFMQGFFCQTKEEAVKLALSLTEENSTVSFGGSQTLVEIGIIQQLKTHNYKVIDRQDGKTPQEQTQLMREALLCDTYFMSTNALTMDGELINIDGNANRVAALCFGPKSVIVIAGVNKITFDLQTALRKIETDACSANCLRLGINTPCSQTGKCGDCYTNSICAQTVVTRLSRVKNRIKVIIVNENLGF